MRINQFGASKLAGAEPNATWLVNSGIILDAKGFILAGDHAGGDRHPLEKTRRSELTLAAAAVGTFPDALQRSDCAVARRAIAWINWRV